jgi:hypothetical protein
MNHLIPSAAEHDAHYETRYCEVCGRWLEKDERVNEQCTHCKEKEDMETGIELIAKERAEQGRKHNISIEEDAARNAGGQLEQAAAAILLMDYDEDASELYPEGWSEDFWLRMPKKPHMERLIIAGALIAAEIDRLQYAESTNATT